MILGKEQLRRLPVTFAPILDPPLQGAQQAIGEPPRVSTLQLAKEPHHLDFRTLLQKPLDLPADLLEGILSCAPRARLFPGLRRPLVNALPCRLAIHACLAGALGDVLRFPVGFHQFAIVRVADHACAPRPNTAATPP